MQKINYDKEMEKEIASLCGEEKKLLLHACCGPCSLSVIERLKPCFLLTVYFYNPNIYPEEEYLRRKEELKEYLRGEGITFMDGDYDVAAYEGAVKGLEEEPEGGKRCGECFELRLKETMRKGKEDGMDYFTTTLTVSPHKNSERINAIGMGLEDEDIRWLKSDFKKQGGYLRGVEKGRTLGMYRQAYCGCQYSMRKESK